MPIKKNFTVSDIEKIIDEVLKESKEPEIPIVYIFDKKINDWRKLTLKDIVI